MNPQTLLDTWAPPDADWSHLMALSQAGDDLRRQLEAKDVNLLSLDVSASDGGQQQSQEDDPAVQARKQNGKIKWFREIVIRASRKPLEDIFRTTAGCEHQNGDIILLFP